MKGEDAIYIRSASLLLHALRRISYLVASRYPPAVAPIRDRAVEGGGDQRRLARQ
jgi:hypothetical protein